MPATDAYWRDINRMHVIFFVSGLAMFAAVIWMMAVDHSDEWKSIQHTGDKIRAEIIEREKQKIESDPEYRESVAKLTEEKAAASEVLEQKKSTVRELEQKVRDAALDLDLTLQRLRNQAADRDVARANFDLQVRDEAPADVQEQYLEKFNAQQKKTDELDLEKQQKTLALNQAREKLRAETDARDEAAAGLKKLQSRIEQLNAIESKLAPTGFSGIKRTIMDWPILDGFNNPTKVTQDWIHIPISLGMASSERFDRCRTCHVNIDAVGAGNVPSFPHGETHSKNYVEWVDQGKYPHPFSTHPRPELYLTASSPHSLEKFGCTSCHDGQGSGTSFTNASHTPNDPIQDEEWHEEYHYASNHFWEYPMQPERLQESTCLKCHHTVVELETSPKFGNSAPKVTHGWELIKKYGCFGCHEINGYDAGKSIGPDLRLEPQTPEEAKKIADDPTQVAGTMRKVGPSLRHISTKTSKGWVEYWTEMPRRFRPTTRMPQFYHLSNQQDALAEKYTPVELAGLAQFLFGKSQPMEFLEPAKDYKPNPERGKTLFSQRGCLACHSHSDFPKAKADFGPNLDRVHAKIKYDKKADADAPNFSKWLYTWIREPERYHPRTKMPHVFLDVYKDKGDDVDPAADITAWLLQKGPESYAEIKVVDGPADAKESEIPAADVESYVRLNLKRTLASERLVEAALGPENATPTEESTRTYPAFEAPPIKGDEIELVNAGAVTATDEPGTYTVSFANPPKGDLQDLKLVWTTGPWAGRKFSATLEGKDKLSIALAESDKKRDKLPGAGDRFYVNGVITPAMKLSYAGRKTVSKYGCYGCHDIPEFEAARPIGVALQDWGRKDPSRLAPEHIHEYLMHHGEPNGGSTQDRIETALKQIRAGEIASPEEKERELSAAYFFENLLHHGRAGFLWQKLREPRSYDYEKIETKGFDERLKMPKFPFNEEEIGAIATFVLGLVAEPPPEKFLFRPGPDGAARVHGEILLEKYNCIGCHSVELPKMTVRKNLDELPYFKGLAPDEHVQALDLLKRLKPPREVIVPVGEDGKGTFTFEGTTILPPDPEETNPEDRAYSFRLWENLSLNGKMLRPVAGIDVPEKDVVDIAPARGGDFAFWLIRSLIGSSRSVEQVDAAWQKAPPTLYREGIKVQTPWLYNFLKEPYQLRHTTVLRMPRFNMSDEEARVLANYFAAADGAPFPYQDVPERRTPYLEEKDKEFDDASGDYLDQAWKILNNPKLCLNCHSVGGLSVQVDPQKPQPRGPNLEYVSDRLRPDWTLLWLYNPKWITPYTAMPALFSKEKPPDPKLLDGNGNAQAVGVRDALMNYHRLMERFGKSPAPPAPAAAAAKEENAQ